MIVLLTLELDEIRDKLLTCPPEAVVRLQGEAVCIQRFNHYLTRQTIDELTKG